MLRAVVVVALLANNAAADDSALGAASGTLRMGYWSSSRSLDDETHILTTAMWMRASPELGTTTSLVLDGWVGYDNLRQGDNTTGVVREAYIDMKLDTVDVRVGKRIIAWGRADAINPTDNLTPRDYTLLVSDDADQRFGVYSAEGRLHLGTLEISAIWLPGLQASIVPLPSTLMFREQSPRWVDSETQGAFKVERSGEKVDWSLSYFDGYDRLPSITPTDSATLLLTHTRTRVIGGDAATVVGKYQLRGEASFTITDNWDGTRYDIPEPFAFVVLGGDRTFGNYRNVNLQTFARVNVHHHDVDEMNPLAVENAVIRNQLDAVQVGTTLRISDKWWNETLEGEVLGIAIFPHASGAVRGRLAYAFSDRWKGIVGFDWFDGIKPSFFENLHRTSTVYAEVRLGL